MNLDWTLERQDGSVEMDSLLLCVLLNHEGYERKRFDIEIKRLRNCTYISICKLYNISVD